MCSYIVKTCGPFYCCQWKVPETIKVCGIQSRLEFSVELKEMDSSDKRPKNESDLRKDTLNVVKATLNVRLGRQINLIKLSSRLNAIVSNNIRRI